VIAQKCLAHLGLAATVGGPIIRHEKASKPLDNLVREAAGIRANEEFWRVIDGIELFDEHSTPLRCMMRIGAQLHESRSLIVNDDTLRQYAPKLGGWILEWCDQFTKAGWET
jgi:hypothetical protein